MSGAMADAIAVERSARQKLEAEHAVMRQQLAAQERRC